MGRSPPRKDGADKVTGRARYLDDLTFPGQLWGRTVRSQVAHGRIKSLTFDPSFDWRGVVSATAASTAGTVSITAHDNITDAGLTNIVAGNNLVLNSTTGNVTLNNNYTFANSISTIAFRCSSLSWRNTTTSSNRPMNSGLNSRSIACIKSSFIRS